MATFLATLAPLLFVGTLFGGLGYYVWATSEKDALYFMRKRQFKHKVLQHGHQSTWDLVDSLIHTTPKDWTKTAHHMYFKPFNGTTIWFTDSLGLNFDIIEGVGKKQVFDLDYFDDTNEVAHGFDYITGNFLSDTDKFRMKHVLFHLKEIYISLKNETYQQEKATVLQEKQTFLAKKKLKQQQLRLLLNQSNGLVDSVQEQDFLLQLTKEKNYQTLLISFEGTLYFQALQMHTLETVDVTFHNDSNKELAIFSEMKSDLIHFAKKVFAKQNAPTFVEKGTEQPIEEPALAAFEADYHEQVHAIFSLMGNLKQDKKWLSMEMYHQINETFPKDLNALSEAYRVVQNKEKIRSDVESSLQTMFNKLQVFADEVEFNKQKEVEKRKLIIEKR